jgi:hypothetical protein
MKKTIKKRIYERYDRMSEDMRELQRMMTKQSVYAGARIESYGSRRPKHVKRYYDLQEM